MRTAFGYSESTYNGDKWNLPLKPPPQYLEHGNGGAPTIWAIFSTSLLNYLRDAGHRAVFKCCTPKDSVKLAGHCFVDDSNIIQIAPSTTTPKNNTIKLPQSVLDLFLGAAQKTDGQVSVNKTKCYPLEFKWDATGNGS